jgi:predicted Zn-dependent protease
VSRPGLVLVAGVAALAAAVLFGGRITGALRGHDAEAAESQSATSPGVYLVALGDFPPPTLARLADGYQATLHLPVLLLPALPLPQQVIDRTRGQVVAEEVLAYLREQHPEVAEHERTALIAVTAEDMYSERKDLKFVFSLPDVGRPYAVVSAARLDPAFAGLRPMPKLAEARLRKVVAKDIALLYLRHPPSGDRRSVLYDGVLTLDDIDLMEESFAPRPYGRKKRAWLQEANAACVSADRAVGGMAPTWPTANPAKRLAAATVSVSVDGELIRRLERLEPSPADRPRALALVALLREANRRDTRALAALGKRWSDEKAETWTLGSLSDHVSLRALSLRLGAESCAAYFAS